ncbi:DNAJB11, partial [Symbiodinium sp. CCMP2592]
QLAVANETIASLKQQNEMLARQQQELYSQIATLQSIVAEVKATSKGIGIGAGFAPAITPIAGPPGPPPPPEPEIFDIGDPEEGEEEQVDDDPIVEPRAVGNNDRGFDGGADAQPHDENEEEDYEAATYKYKDLQDLKMPQLPKDNVGFRSWRNALLTQYSAIDRTGQARRTFGWLWEQFSDHLAELREDANERQDANAKAKSIATAVPAKDTAVPAAPGKPPKGRLLHLPPLFVLTFLRLHMKLGRSLTPFESLRAQGVYTDDLVCHEDEPVSFETGLFRSGTRDPEGEDIDLLAESDLYRILGLPRSAKADDIKRAYRKRFHPDKNPDDPDAKLKFQKAFTVLSDENKRAKYDNSGDMDLEGFDVETFMEMVNAAGLKFQKQDRGSDERDGRDDFPAPGKGLGGHLST